MDKKVLKEVKELCKPLKKLTPLLKSIWIYGSFTKKKKYNPKSDIDIMVVVDDSRPNYSQSFTKKLMFYLKIIEAKAKKKGIKLHFQPPKEASFLWELIRNGEPWVITSFRNTYTLLDESGFAKNLGWLIKRRERGYF